MRVARESTKTTLAITSRRNPINPRHVINHQTLSARFQVGSSSCIVFPISERWHHAEVDKCGFFPSCLLLCPNSKRRAFTRRYALPLSSNRDRYLRRRHSSVGFGLTRVGAGEKIRLAYIDAPELKGDHKEDGIASGDFSATGFPTDPSLNQQPLVAEQGREAWIIHASHSRARVWAGVGKGKRPQRVLRPMPCGELVC